MERIKTIVGSGVRKINLVAPMVRLSAPLRQEILKSPFKGLSLSEGTLMRSGEGWCDIVAFSRRDEELVTSYVLLNSIVYQCSIPGALARDIYQDLRSRPLQAVSCKGLMRRHGLKSFYVARDIVRHFVTCGLFIGIPSADRPLRLLPYYCEERDDDVCVIRHLLSLGYSITIEGKVLRARLGSQNLIVGRDIDSINAAGQATARILVSAGSPVLNFSGIRSWRPEDFLEAKRLL